MLKLMTPFLRLMFTLVLAFVTSGVVYSQSITGARMECTGGSVAGFACHNVHLLSLLRPQELGMDVDENGIPNGNAELSDMWGWYDDETEREFILVGRYDGTAFVEVTDPVNPVYVGYLPRSGSRSNFWYDMKVFNDFAYIVADGTFDHGLQVFDLRELLAPNAMPTTFEMSSLYSGFSRAHNIFINEQSGFAYVTGASGGNACGRGLHILDLSAPLDPVFAGCYAEEGTGLIGTGYTHDVQCVIYHGPDPDHGGKEVCFLSNETDLVIADVSDKSEPVNISKANYPLSEYTHQGWLSEDHRFFFQGDELDEWFESPSGVIEFNANVRTLVWDVEDLDDPVLLAQYFADRQTIDHNMYVKGNLMYQSQYADGLRIVNISDPENLVEVGFFDTHPQNRSVWDGSWSNYPYLRSGAVAVSSSIDGLFLLEPASSLMVASEKNSEIPEIIVVTSFFPNPFSGTGTLLLELDHAQQVRVELIDLLGRTTGGIFSGHVEAGSDVRIELVFSTYNLPSGLYTLRITGESFETFKTILLANE